MNKRFLAFLAAVFAVKLVVVWQLKDHVLLQPDAGLDTTAYLALAARVAAGDLWLGPGLYYVSPLYIYFVAAVLAATGSVVAVRLVQVMLGTCSVALIWWMADRWSGRRAAWIAGALAAGTGLFTFYEILLLQAAIEPVLTASALAALTAALRGGAPIWFLAAGAAFGVQSLNRPNVLLASGVVVLYLAARRSYRASLLTAVGLLLALAPVIVRNGTIADDWSPVASHGGLNFYIGNNPAADGTYHAVPGIRPSIAGQEEDSRRVAEQALGRSLSDAEVSSYFYGLGVAWIRNAPADAAKLFGRKLVYVFHASHLSLNFSYPFFAHDAGTLLQVLVVGPWLLVPLGILGLAWATWHRTYQDFAIWAAFVPAYAFSVATFFVAERYRLPLLVPLCVGAGIALDSAVTLLHARRRAVLGSLLALCLTLAIIVNWPFGLDDARAEERTRMAERLIALGRFEEASTWVAKAADIHPQPGLLHFRIGRAYLAANRTSDAIVELQRSAALDPGQPEIDFALGEALLQAGRAADAVPHLRRAWERGVRPDLSGYDLARALDGVGDRAGALSILRSVRPARADDAESWYGLGQLAMQLQSTSLAEHFFQECVKVRPAFAPAHQQLGVVYGVSGRRADAARELQQAINLEPADPVSHLNLAVVYAQMGRAEDARREAGEALRLKPDYTKARELLEALR